MSREELAALFKPYFRPSSARAGGGLGLGMYIVSEIARAHGGSAAATGQDGELTFTLLIPLLAPAARKRFGQEVTPAHPRCSTTTGL